MNCRVTIHLILQLTSRLLVRLLLFLLSVLQTTFIATILPQIPYIIPVVTVTGSRLLVCVTVLSVYLALDTVQNRTEDWVRLRRPDDLRLNREKSQSKASRDRPG